MYDYGESCPVSKATALLGERWTLLIIREMFLGASRFSDFQKVLPKISTSLLNSRLKTLVDSGIAMRKRTPEKRGYEYRLTPAGKSLGPLLNELGDWAKTWVYGEMTDEEIDIDSLIRAIATSIDPDHLPAGDTVLQFRLTDIEVPSRFYIAVKDGKPEVCDENSGHEVDVFVECTANTLSEIWWGQKSIATARQSGELRVTGPTVYTKNLGKWLNTRGFAGCDPGRSAEKKLSPPA